MATIRFCPDAGCGVRPVGSPIGGWTIDGVAGAIADAFPSGSIKVLIKAIIAFELFSTNTASLVAYKLTRIITETRLCHNERGRVCYVIKSQTGYVESSTFATFTGKKLFLCIWSRLEMTMTTKVSLVTASLTIWPGVVFVTASNHERGFSVSNGLFAYGMS